MSLALTLFLYQVTAPLRANAHKTTERRWSHGNKACRLIERIVVWAELNHRLVPEDYFREAGTEDSERGSGCVGEEALIEGRIFPYS